MYDLYCIVYGYDLHSSDSNIIQYNIPVLKKKYFSNLFCIMAILC